MSKRSDTLTPRMREALKLLVGAGSLNITVRGDVRWDEIPNRTAWALERRGLAKRVYTGARHQHELQPTFKGCVEAENLAALDPDTPEERER